MEPIWVLSFQFTFWYFHLSAMLIWNPCFFATCNQQNRMCVRRMKLSRLVSSTTFDEKSKSTRIGWWHLGGRYSTDWVDAMRYNCRWKDIANEIFPTMRIKKKFRTKTNRFRLFFSQTNRFPSFPIRMHRLMWLLEFPQSKLE